LPTNIVIANSNKGFNAASTAISPVSIVGIILAALVCVFCCICAYYRKNRKNRADGPTSAYERWIDYAEKGVGPKNAGVAAAGGIVSINGDDNNESVVTDMSNPMFSTKNLYSYPRPISSASSRPPSLFFFGSPLARRAIRFIKVTSEGNFLTLSQILVYEKAKSANNLALSKKVTTASEIITGLAEAVLPRVTDGVLVNRDLGSSLGLKVKEGEKGCWLLLDLEGSFEMIEKIVFILPTGHSEDPRLFKYQVELLDSSHHVHDSQPLQFGPDLSNYTVIFDETPSPSSRRI